MTLGADILTDIDTFLETDEFAVSATWNSTTINGIFNNAYVDIEGGEVPVQGYRPTLLCKASAVTSAAHGQSVVIAGVTYAIRGVQPNETGDMTLLVLEKQ